MFHYYVEYSVFLDIIDALVLLVLVKYFDPIVELRTISFLIILYYFLVQKLDIFRFNSIIFPAQYFGVDTEFTDERDNDIVFGQFMNILQKQVLLFRTENVVVTLFIRELDLDSVLLMVQDLYFFNVL